MKTQSITTSFVLYREDLDFLDEKARSLDLSRSQLLRSLVRGMVLVPGAAAPVGTFRLGRQYRPLISQAKQSLEALASAFTAATAGGRAVEAREIAAKIDIVRDALAPR